MSRLSSGGSRRVRRNWGPTLKEHNKQPTEIQHTSRSLKNVWGIKEGYMFIIISEKVLEGQESLVNFSQNKGAGGHHFLCHHPHTQHKQRAICRNQHGANTHYLTCLHHAFYPPHHALADLSPPICSWAQHIQSSATSLAVYKQPGQELAPLQSDFCSRERER